MCHADESRAVEAGPFRGPVRPGREGCFRLPQDEAGRWWLFDPQGETFFFSGVHDTCRSAEHDDAGLPPDAAARLRAWGFNALGVGGETTLRDDGLPFLASAEFCSVGQSIVVPGVR